MPIYMGWRCSCINISNLVQHLAQVLRDWNRREGFHGEAGRGCLGNDLVDGCHGGGRPQNKHQGELLNILAVRNKQKPISQRGSIIQTTIFFIGTPALH